VHQIDLQDAKWGDRIFAKRKSSRCEELIGTRISDLVENSLAEFIDDRLEDQDRTGGTEYGQRLAGEEAVSDAADEA